MTYVIGFIASAGIIVLASLVLARAADGIAEATGVGRLWIGTVVLAGATSLPELTTDIAAVRLGAPDLAVGDLFGSSMANMLILAVIDLVVPRKEVLRHATPDHALAASVAIALNAFAAVLVLARPRASLLGVDPGSVIILVAYLLGTRVVHRHTLRDGAQQSPAAEAGGAVPARRGGRRPLLEFVAAALVILVTAPLLAWSAKGLAVATGLGNTFVGTWLVGLATSLPELATCLAAIRIGAFDLAVGNLFGSNAFNMVILVALDLAQPGSLYVTLDPDHALTSLLGVVLMSLGVAAIVFRAKRRLALIEPTSLLMVLTYGYGLWLLYRHVGA